MSLVRWLIGILTLCLVTVGCTSGGSGQASSSTRPTTSAAASPSASATPTRSGPLTTGPGVKPGEVPPTLSSAALKSDVVGAENFATFYFAALDWSLATTDAYLLKQASSPDCAPCQEYISAITDLEAEGGHLEGARVGVKGYSLTTGNLAEADFVIKVNLSQTAGTSVLPNQSPSPAASSNPNSSDYLYLKWNGTAWWVVEIGLAQ
jgi:Family of unknown function (DUF6318)